MGVLMTCTFKNNQIHRVSQTEGRTNSKETVITDTKLGSIFYNVLTKLDSDKCTEGQLHSAHDKSTYSSTDDIFSNYCTMKHNSREKEKERLLYKQV